MPTTTKRSRGKTIAWVVAALLATGGVVFLLLGNIAKNQFYEIIDAKPLDTAVDFSRPGEFSSALHQTCGMCDSQGLWLVVPGRILEGSEPLELLAPLKAECRIVDAQGNEVVSETITGASLSRRFPSEDEMCVWSFAPFPEGEYTVHVKVLEGVPQLAGMNQRLVARYELCGCALIPAFYGFVLGIGFLALAFITVTVVWIVVWRH